MQEEQKETLERRHREEVEKQIRQRIETRESLSKQMDEVAERRRQEAREDAKYKDEVRVYDRNISFIAISKSKIHGLYFIVIEGVGRTGEIGSAIGTEEKNENVAIAKRY